MLSDLHSLRAPRDRSGQNRSFQRSSKHSKKTGGCVDVLPPDQKRCLEAASTVPSAAPSAEQEQGIPPLRHHSEPTAFFTKREITEARLSKCVVMIPR